MRTDTFGDSKASMHLAEEITKDYPRKDGKFKIGEKQSAFVTRQLTALGKTLNQLSLLEDIQIKRSLAYRLRESYVNNTINTKCIISDSVRSFTRNVIVTKINVWLDKQNDKERRKLPDQRGLDRYRKALVSFTGNEEKHDSGKAWSNAEYESWIMKQYSGGTEILEALKIASGINK